ncbi:MAG: hypothetical protein IT461_08785 [Planctomycetes bacterium]|jgi:hypothetical protein|nr:hypothetical protein [Planctomycetota bacterium]
MTPLTLVIAAMIVVLFMVSAAVAVWYTIKRGDSLDAHPELGDITTLD